MSESFDPENKLVIAEGADNQEEKNEPSTSGMSGDRPSKRVGRRPGRRTSKMDVRAKLERSRQSARECRARKKLRYQYLEDLVANREKAVFALRDELELYKQWCLKVDQGLLPLGLLRLAKEKESADIKKGSAENLEGAEDGNSSDVTEQDDISIAQNKDSDSRRHFANPVTSKHSTGKTPVSAKNRIYSKGKSQRVKTLTSTNPETKYDSDTRMEASGFLTDLSSYGPIVLGDTRLSVVSTQEIRRDLNTIPEEDSSESIGRSKCEKELSLLPTFVDELGD